ncbi:MAG TPA: creatininase family protein [Gemmatimonadaceae bacterium]|nr:creatininase family protein [Gemmatimonadaceae bacterium]
MNAEPFNLSDTTWQTVRGTKYEVAVLPWGATEAHNFHLPYGTDNFESAYVASESARRAWNAGARVAVLPGVPFGVNTGQLDIRLCINMNPSTQAAVLGDIARSLEQQGVKKLLILNGHGGNDFRQMIRELQPSCGVFICTINWWSCVDSTRYFDEPGDHAGELETSVMMNIAPHTVLPLDQAGEGNAKGFRVAGLRDGWAWAPRAWSKVTDDTGVGNPSASTVEKGRRFLDAVTEQIGGFIVELAEADLGDLYDWR